jgi:hypothetical protein
MRLPDQKIEGFRVEMNHWNGANGDERLEWSRGGLNRLNKAMEMNGWNGAAGVKPFE